MASITWSSEYASSTTMTLPIDPGLLPKMPCWCQPDIGGATGLPIPEIPSGFGRETRGGVKKVGADAPRFCGPAGPLIVTAGHFCSCHPGLEAITDGSERWIFNGDVYLAGNLNVREKRHGADTHLEQAVADGHGALPAREASSRSGAVRGSGDSRHRGTATGSRQRRRAPPGGLPPRCAPGDGHGAGRVRARPGVRADSPARVAGARPDRPGER